MVQALGWLTIGAGAATFGWGFQVHEDKKTMTKVVGVAVACLGCGIWFVGDATKKLQLRLVDGNSLLPCKHLHTVTLANCPELTNAMFERITELQNLRELVIDNCNGLTDSALAILAQCPNLESVTLINCAGFSDQAIDHLASISGLRELTLSGLSGVHSEGLSRLSELTQLERLTLRDLAFNDAALTLPPNLRQLTLSHLAQIEGDGLSALANCASLEVLHILDCPKLNEKAWNALRELDGSHFKQVLIVRCEEYEQLCFPANDFAGELTVRSR